MLSPVERFERWLKDRGHYVTQLRLATAEVMPRYHGRMTCRELTEAVSQRVQSSVGENSMRWNLRLMEDAKIIRHVVVRKGTPGRPREYYLYRP